MIHLARLNGMEVLLKQKSSSGLFCLFVLLSRQTELLWQGYFPNCDEETCNESQQYRTLPAHCFWLAFAARIRRRRYHKPRRNRGGPWTLSGRDGRWFVPRARSRRDFLPGKS